MEAEMSGAAAPACFPRMPVRTPLRARLTLTRSFLREVSALPVR